jgi:hypothetical protein
MPHSYIPPLGIPYYWRDETSEILSEVIHAYLEKHQLTAKQFAILKVYLNHWIFAPCWSGEKELAQLRDRVTQLQSIEEVDQWLEMALDNGIDPL